jgi:hypothetical protein
MFCPYKTDYFQINPYKKLFNYKGREKEELEGQRVIAIEEKERVRNNIIIK